MGRCSQVCSLGREGLGFCAFKEVEAKPSIANEGEV